MLDNSLDLFPEFENEWQKEWKDMPEFVSENKKPSQQIIVSFKNYNDVKLFAELLDIKLTPKTNAIWFPFREFDKGEVYTNLKWKKNDK